MTNQEFVHGHGVFRDQRSPNQATVKSMWGLNWMGVMLVSRSCRWKHSHPRLQGGIVHSYVHYGWTLGNCSGNVDATVNTLLGSISKHLIPKNLWTLFCSQFCTWSFFLARPAASGKTKIQEISRAVKSLCFLDFLLVLQISLISGTSVTPEIQQISCAPGCQRKISCRVAYRWQTRVTFRPFRLDCKFQDKNWSVLTVDLVHCFWLR